MAALPNFGERLEPIQELSRRENRRAVPKCEQVIVAGDERDLFASREGQQVVILRIRRTHRWRSIRIGNHLSELAQQLDEPFSISRLDARAQLRMRECALDLDQQRWTHDELKGGV